MATKKFDALFTAQNIYLFNLLYRHQVYLEGVKAGFAQNYRELLTQIYSQFAAFIHGVRYERMDSFTRKELITFVYRFKRAQIQFYSIYTQQLIKILQDFLATDVEVTRDIYVHVTGRTPEQENDLTATEHEQLTQTANQLPTHVDASPLYGISAISGDDAGNESLWATVSNAPVPANGQTPEQMIAWFVNYAITASSSLITKAYANAWTPQETLEAFTGIAIGRNAQAGDPDGFRGGVLSRLAAANDAVVNTLVQHTSAIVQMGIGSAYLSYYQWASILDSRTSEVCRTRDGNIYVVGEGPLPPAHPNCRSRTFPLYGEQPIDLATAGFPEYNVTPPLTLDQFVKKMRASYTAN
jgi:hypothetical protein